MSVMTSAVRSSRPSPYVVGVLGLVVVNAVVLVFILGGVGETGAARKMVSFDGAGKCASAAQDKGGGSWLDYDVHAARFDGGRTIVLTGKGRSARCTMTTTGDENDPAVVAVEVTR